MLSEWKKKKFTDNSAGRNTGRAPNLCPVGLQMTFFIKANPEALKDVIKMYLVISSNISAQILGTAPGSVPNPLTGLRVSGVMTHVLWAAGPLKEDHPGQREGVRGRVRGRRS